MELTSKLLSELQRRLKIGNRKGVHLNAIPGNSRYKFDLNRLSYIDKNIPDNFIKSLLSEQPLKFRITWKENVPDLNSLFEEEQSQLVRITKAFENLINQTDAIESEKGINTFGFGFPILARRDRADNKLTVAPILIWSLRIKRTNEFNTWEIIRSEDDPIYINEVLINHLQNDSQIEIEQIPSEMLDDGLIHKENLIEICTRLIQAVNSITPSNLEDIFREKLDKIVSIGDKTHYEKLLLNSTNSLIDFGGLFSIFEVQKQNIINDYDSLMELEGVDIPLDDLEGHSFQSISSVETDPSQQSILNSLETSRNVLIQGPPGTGKSQTLTAILVNALENNKTTIVVCEKKTALEVLHKSLVAKGLGDNAVLIRDIAKDRKTVVDSVRLRVDSSDYKRYRYNYSKENLENIINKTKNLVTSINNKHQKIGKELIGRKNWTAVVGDLLTELRGKNDHDVLNFQKPSFNYTHEELNSLLDIVHKGQLLYESYLPIKSASFINSQKLIGENPYSIEQNIHEDFAFYSLKVEQIKELLEANRDEYVALRQSQLQNQVAEINATIEKLATKESELTSLLSSSKEKYLNFRNEELYQLRGKFDAFTSQIHSILSEHKNNSDITNEGKINSFKYKLLSLLSGKRKKVINDHFKLLDIFSNLKTTLKESKDLENVFFRGLLIDKVNDLQQAKANFSDLEKDFATKIESEFNGFQLNSILDAQNNHLHRLDGKIANSKIETANFLSSLRSLFSNYLKEIEKLFQTLTHQLSENHDVKLSYVFERSFYDNKALLSEIQSKIATIINEFETTIQTEFSKISLLKMNSDNIGLKSLPILQNQIKDLSSRFNSDNWINVKLNTNDLQTFLTELQFHLKAKNDYFNSERDLFTIEFRWYQYFNNLSDIEKSIVNELKTTANWKKALLIFYLNSMLVSSATIDLPTDDEEHKQLGETLKEIEKEQLNFIKAFWYSKQIDATRSFYETNKQGITVENLYNKKSSFKNKRHSLRQIVQIAPDLFSTFFPIILTSPDVASNLFKGMNGYFDMVMFDEASQLRLEDNLPAILKGKQIVIAGDEHQMPPSNYFSKVFDGAVEDEDDIEEEDSITRVDKDDILLSCESLLDFGAELNFQKKYLDFHYRSRHPFLIDFSNYAFYNKRLKPLPNNFDYVPIKYVQVNGSFSDHTNEAEAEMVLSIIDKNINRLPNGKYPTLGIATFNISQRNLIQSKILERHKFQKYAEFNAKIQELEENGMFIKNLENIQGDERDVIILSTTYGISKDGKFYQRFGPINHSKGYKLLNVIITRAKYKIYCCTSIPEQVFLNYKEYLTIEGSNNKRAVMYAYLAYCKAVSESNHDSRLSVLTALAENSKSSVSIHPTDFGELESPFEEEVYQNLVDHFGTEKLIPQLQFAGFRIDIVYNPQKKGLPKIAIECDGAKYHSSREAYLYDRHRQKILEDHGFVFHRIWSTNWWRNRQREFSALVKFIEQTEATSTSKRNNYAKTALAFTDDIEDLEKDIIKNSLEEGENNSDTIKGIEQNSLIKKQKSAEDAIKLNSRVHVKYMNNGKEMLVELVATEKNKSTAKGIQKIYYKSPLAASLIGHTVGDIIKLGNLDNFVEIMEVTNLG